MRSILRISCTVTEQSGGLEDTNVLEASASVWNAYEAQLCADFALACRPLLTLMKPMAGVEHLSVREGIHDARNILAPRPVYV